MKETFAQQVYLTLSGLYIPCYNIPGVENAFADGERCQKLYFDAREAYTRICERFGEEDGDDEDVEQIFSAFLDITEILCLKMYHYGALFGERPPYDYSVGGYSDI